MHGVEKFLWNLFKKSILKGKSVFSLIYFDIDNFKNINDNYSHSTGDYVLKELIHITKAYLREYDSISRWGGDEFLILLPNTSLKNAYILTERIKSIIINHDFYYHSLKLNITCSFGIVEASLNKSINEIINKADELLYKSKKLGRNRISK
jgi:diguanylate cyclase